MMSGGTCDYRDVFNQRIESMYFQALAAAINRIDMLESQNKNRKSRRSRRAKERTANGKVHARPTAEE